MSGPRKTLTLPDGRRLDVLEAGAPSGVPALHVHGTPSSARESHWLDRAARTHDVRIVAFDRAGYLGSSPADTPSLLGGAHDALAIADILGLGRFATVGFSGGAGYALATAAVAPDRVTVAHLCGGLAAGAGGELSRARRVAFGGAVHVPWLVRPLLAGALRLNLRGLEKRLGDPRAAARWFFEGPARGAQIAAVEAYVGAADPAELEVPATGRSTSPRSRLPWTYGTATPILPSRSTRRDGWPPRFRTPHSTRWRERAIS